jgi:pyruvate/2-oxoglutarate dehydrogenase complex dihydrolipoamide dehydrogenase (E3) component
MGEGRFVALDHDFRVVRDNLKGGYRTTNDRIVPFCKFTDPELARVGCNESEAKRDKNQISRSETADGECAPQPPDCRTAARHL